MAALAKCPRCELNYVRPGEKYCPVCQREMKGLDDQHEHTEICPVCGIRPVLPHTELCAQCTREQKALETPIDDTYDGTTEELLNEVDDLDRLDDLEIIEEEDDEEMMVLKEELAGELLDEEEEEEI